MKNDPHADARILSSGVPRADASSALIAIHGRGATAASISGLASTIGAEGMAFLAPQAEGNTWYPYSFLEPIERNEPWLSSALNCVQRVIEDVVQAGIAPEKIALVGFSQGACLALEFAVRNPRRYLAVIGLSGGVIGPPGTTWNSKGSLDGTPVFLGCSDIDSHVPLERVHRTTQVLTDLSGNVTERIYPGMGHTVNEEEINYCRSLLA